MENKPKIPEITFTQQEVKQQLKINDSIVKNSLFIALSEYVDPEKKGEIIDRFYKLLEKSHEK